MDQSCRLRLVKGGGPILNGKKELPLAQRLDNACTDKQFTYAELARRSGVPLTTVHNALTGKTVPGEDTLEDLCGPLDLDFEPLLKQRDQEAWERYKQRMKRRRERKRKGRGRADANTGVKTMT